MKVVFTGTIFVGKSTLIEDFARRPHVAIVREVARELIAQDPSIEHKSEFQNILFSEQVRRETEAINSGAKVVICDRSIADNIAHSRYYGHPIAVEWKDWLKTYDHFFLFAKNDFPFQIERYPEGNDWIGFRDNLHQHIQSVLSEYALPYSDLSGSHEARRSIVESLISVTESNSEIRTNYRDNLLGI